MDETAAWSWKFNPDNLTLQLLSEHGRLKYEVDLEQCRTAAETLDWIAQIAGKKWTTDRIVGGLVRELDYRLSLQGNLCGGGKEGGPIEVPKILERVAAENARAKAAVRPDGSIDFSKLL